MFFTRLGPGQDNLDKKSVYESSMTLLERRLYFTTAHAHLRSGCPTLALEVLSKLPDNVIDPDNPDTGGMAYFFVDVFSVLQIDCHIIFVFIYDIF